MMRWVSFVIAAACSGRAAPPAAPVTPPAEADPEGPHRAAVAAQVQPLIDAELATGIVVGLYDAGKREIYGFGTGPGGGPPDGRTLFELGAVTQVFTALLFADAVQRREVALDTPVADLLPPGVTVPTRDDRPIVLRHLALHSSGLPRLPPSLQPRAQAPDPFAGYGEDGLYRDLVRMQLDVTPGTQFHYSDLGAGLLGFALGKKLGGYREALESRVLAPLELGDTHLVVPAAAAARRARGTDEDLRPVPAWTFDALAGAGALVSSARDQLALIDAELDAHAGGKQPLRPAMRLTQEAQLDGGNPNQGLGWHVDGDGRYWQAGTTGGFRSFVGFDPSRRRGVVVLASSSVSLIDSLARRMYGVLAGDAVEPPAFPTAEDLGAYAGTYEFQGMKLAVTVAGKRLYVEGPGEPKIRMLPITRHEFWIERLQSVCVFERDGAKVTRAVFVIGERQLSAPRID